MNQARPSADSSIRCKGCYALEGENNSVWCDRNQVVEMGGIEPPSTAEIVSLLRV
jgi:hypothetical protein